jgi:putative ABC transport system permease protein
VNASLAMRYFGTLDVVGKSIALTPFVPGAKPVAQTIVGLTGDTRTSYARAPEPQLYVPAAQIPLALFYVVRTKDAGFPLADASAALFSRIDPSVAPPSVESYSALLSRDAVRSQTAMLLFGILAMLAFVLSLAGIYAVTAYSVEQRTQEFGIRQAIGAHGSDVLRDVMRGALLQTLTGIAGGLIVAAVFSRFLADLLFDVSPLDPATFTAVIALTVCAVAAASAIPAFRAARIQPAAAIRYE